MLVFILGLKRGFDDYRDDRDSRRDRREDYIADDGRSRYSDSKYLNISLNLKYRRLWLSGYGCGFQIIYLSLL
jgi:hypothetical protein